MITIIDTQSQYTQKITKLTKICYIFFFVTNYATYQLCKFILNRAVKTIVTLQKKKIKNFLIKHCLAIELRLTLIR